MSDLFDFFRVERQIDNGREEMQRLAAEKIHRTEGFEKQRGRSSHPPFHHCIRHPFKQREIFKGEDFLFRANRKRVLQSLAKFIERLGEGFLGEGGHKCMESLSKTNVETHYMEGSKQSQFVDNRRSVLNNGVFSASPWTDAPSKLARILLLYGRPGFESRIARVERP